MAKKWIFALLIVYLGYPVISCAEPKGVQRGELLYSTYCIACHNEKIHWRENKVARDWVSLKAQVSRWQGIQGLAWGDSDIVEVARYLDTRYYRFPELVQ